MFSLKSILVFRSKAKQWKHENISPIQAHFYMYMNILFINIKNETTVRSTECI